MKKNKGTSLKFVKIKDISIIPRYLFEQIKPREYNIDRIYEYGPIFLSNPLHIMGGFLDKEENVKGVMWVSFNPMSNKLHIHILSIDKEYQGASILKEVRGIAVKLKKNVKADKIIWQTSRSRAISKIAGQESKLKIMEL